jgi:ribonucleoside-diphosphate reductase alpha chain
MHIKKRNGNLEEVNLNKIVKRIQNLSLIDEIDVTPLNVDAIEVAKKVISGLYDGVTTVELDNLAAETAASMITVHPDYDKLAARIEISALHKETSNFFYDKMLVLNKVGIIDANFLFNLNGAFCNDLVDYKRDYYLDYFGIKTLKKSYLLKNHEGKIIERPQDMWMRVAYFINSGNLERIEESYNLMSQKYFTHATPTLFNAGTIKSQLSSCFLLDINEDSIEGIYKTLSDCAKISQSAGGIGLSISKIRSKGSYINGTNGTSNGIVPMLRVFDSTMRYVDQGGNKRKGSAAMYIEPWHADIFEFLELKKNHGKEELRARDLFYALWIPDLFMRRVEEDGDWTLFDPKYETALIESIGEKFEERYEQRESIQGYGRKIKARDLWDKIIENQIETGTPYMLYKDAANRKSNQKNLGTIKSSNLCTEIIQYTDEKETAVCNLASISLPAFVVVDKFDHRALYKAVQHITRNLDQVIDLNYYPVVEAENSNLKHRPIGMGVQGLADVFAKLKLAYTSEEAKLLNKHIFETIYKAAIDESIKLAKEKGTYQSFDGSPASEGQLQFDLWPEEEISLLYDWSETKEQLKRYGLRNSLLVAPMPTASTSQILGNTESFEPFTSNIYSRRTLSGEFVVVNKWLVEELISEGLWNEDVKNKILLNNGSIQGIDIIPQGLKDRYKTVWEISMKDYIDMSSDRGRFICQSQSLNLYMSDPSYSKLTSMHFYAWKKGLKTGMYYLRSKPATNAIKFTVNKQIIPSNDKELESQSDFECVGCSS